MEVIVKLLVVSINWQNGNFYVVLENGRIPEEKTKLSEINQPINVAKDMSEELVTLSKQWMNHNLCDTYFFEDSLHVIYKTIIPHDPELKLNNGCEWKDIKHFESEDKYLIQALDSAIKGIS